MYDCFCIDLHVGSLSAASVCLCVPVQLCVCAEKMQLSCRTSKMLARLAARLHADRPSLMNNYLQQCKTNPLIMMRRWAEFQHDSRQMTALFNARLCNSELFAD